MVANLRKKSPTKNEKCADIITWPVLTNEDGFDTVKGISEQATVDYIHKICEKVGNDNIRATYLD